MTKTMACGLTAAAILTASVAIAAEKFVVVERPTDEITTHTHKKPDAAGDILTFANPLFDAANKVATGTDQGFCLRVVPGKAWECNFTILLKGGQITVEGPFMDTGDSVFTVLGGTGKYSGAKGAMSLHPLEGKPEALQFSFDLQ